MVHVRHVIVRYRTSRRTSPYEPPYGTSSYGTVRVAAPEPTRRRTAPYESPYDDVRATVWHCTRHRMIPYEPPYVSVRCVVRCRTATRTVIIRTSGPISKIEKSRAKLMVPCSTHCLHGNFPTLAGNLPAYYWQFANLSFDC